MDTGKEERIRTRAHEIWEREGRPEGDHERHWQQAMREIEEEDAVGQTGPAESGLDADLGGGGLTSGRRAGRTGSRSAEKGAPPGQAAGKPKRTTKK
jgi:hypothetical protein